MSINETFFWNGEREYGEEELEIMVNSFMRSGVGISDDGVMDLKPSISVNGKSVVLGSGSAMSGGHFYSKDASVTLTPSSSCYGKKCALFIRTLWTTKNTAPIIVAGTSLAAPAPTRDFGETYDITICTFTVSSGGNVSNLIDTRSDTTVCGAIRARDSSEMDEYYFSTQERFEALLTAVSGASGFIQCFVQTETPTGAVAGALWFRTDKNGIFCYDGSTWNRIGRLMDSSDRVFGVTISSDEGPTSKRFTIPFDISKVHMSDNTSYAKLSGGNAVIQKNGVYRITLAVVISANAIPNYSSSTGKWHFAIIKNSSTTSPIGEGYFIADKYTDGSSSRNQCSGTVTGVQYLAKGDRIAGSCFLDQTGSKRVACDRTYMIIEPLDLEFSS